MDGVAKVHCDICRRPHDSQRLPFLCAVDARNRLYQVRLENAAALMENEELERQVNAALSPPAANEVDEGALRSSARVELEISRSREAAAVDKASQVMAQADKLKAEIDAVRKEIEERKERNSRRRSDLATVSNGIPARRTRQLDDTERAIMMTKYKWNRCADTMVATRAFLCEEAARLYGLRQVRKGNAKRYEIGGVEIAELHAMNSMPPEVISTSLAHVAHVLVLASHYLAIRLPAEITLPHSDYPRPTIFSVASSYQHGEVAFPESSVLSRVPSDAGGARDGGGTGAGASGARQRPPRPRPLYLDKPMATLAREDPAAYSLFLEGVTLLAYDIAWVCCAQGVSMGDKNSYEDMCNIGQNLWRLLIGDQLHRRSVEPAFPPASSPKDESGGAAASASVDVARSKARIGRWSHGAAHSYLGGAEGSEFVRNFKLLSPTKLVDRLKKRLSSEAPMLEWEKIDGDEVRAVEREGEGVQVGGGVGVMMGQRRRGDGVRENVSASDGSRATTRTGGGDAGGSGGDSAAAAAAAAAATPDSRTRTGKDGGGDGEERARSGSGATSGWTKLKTR